MFAGVAPSILCCHLILNLRESYNRQLVITTTQAAELSEWGSRLPEPHISRGLDSMGLPKISCKRLDFSQIPAIRLFLFIVIIGVANDAESSQSSFDALGDPQRPVVL